MSRLGNWYSEQKRYFRFWREHRKEIVARTRAHTIRGMAIYFTAIAGFVILAVVKPPVEWTIICSVGLAINMFASLWWLAKRDSEVIKELKKEYNYNHVPTPPP